MTDLVIVGAGWAGCAAAVAAAKQGARVRLLERTDMILGTGLVGGILRNNGRLTAALELEGQPRVCALFAGTDGTDGPTDAAGGFAFSDSVARMGGREAARALLAENNSNAALALSGDLLITGPTRTNVMDLAVLLVDRP